MPVSEISMLLADTSKCDIGWKKWVMTGWAVTEIFLFGGLMHGWGSLVFILKKEGIYSDLCPRNITIDLTNWSKHDLNLSLHNSTGQMIKSVTNSIDQLLIDLSSEPSGLYFLSVYENGKSIYSEKLIKL